MLSHLRLFVVAMLLTAAVTVQLSYSRERTTAEPQAAQTAAASHPTIVFMTDFGTANDAVAICRAVIFSIAPADVRLTDITHQVTPFSIEEGSRFLAGVIRTIPAAQFFWWWWIPA